ncbi:MAG TPA: YoaK family protein [Mycobacterium sp.]
MPANRIVSPLSERLTVAALLLLTFATGLVDAVSVLLLGHVFVANMTGNAIFLGFLFVPGPGIDLTAAVLAFSGFLPGAILGGRLVRHLYRDTRRWLTVALGIEIALLVGLSALAGAGVLRYQDNTKLVLIAGLAAAFGLQNATARQFGIQELYTTVLTSTIVGIGVDSRLAGGAGRREKLRYSVVLVMVGGAIVGATLSQVVVAPVIASAAVLVTVSLLLFRFG